MTLKTICIKKGLVWTKFFDKILSFLITTLLSVSEN